MSYNNVQAEAGTRIMWAIRILLCVLAYSMAVPPSAKADDRLVSTNLDVRTVLGFRVANAAVQRLLPDGWEPVPAADGTNALLILADSLINEDVSGKIRDSAQIVTLAAPARRRGSDERAAMAIGGFLSSAELMPGPYFNYAVAATRISRRTSTDEGGRTNVEETWTLRSDQGDSLEFSIRLVQGPLKRTKVSAKVYSSVKPSFYRSYRVEQLVDSIDLVRSSARVEQLSFKVKGAQLTALFDGSEQMTSVTWIPFYSRQVYLPN